MKYRIRQNLPEMFIPEEYIPKSFFNWHGEWRGIDIGDYYVAHFKTFEEAQSFIKERIRKEIFIEKIHEGS